ALMAAAAAAILAAAPAEDRKGDLKAGASALVGTYSIVAGERDGRPEPPERVLGTVVRFTETTVSVTDKDKKETFSASYTLDASKTPCRITLTSTVAPVKGEVAEGLIKKDGDTVTLIYALPGGAAPTAFKTGAKQMMFVLKKQPR